MSDEPVACRSTDGLDLEAVASEPAEATRAFVFCHPHPQMGGTMNAPLLLALRDRLVSQGWGVFRFNFRGIGESQGESADGIAEVADAEGALTAARERWPSLPLVVGGWSFGGAVAVRVAARDRHLEACATIAPAIRPKEGITAGVPPAAEIELACRLLAVCGANDEQVSSEDCRTWVEGVEGGSYVEVPGANHFFWAKYEQLATLLTEWLDEVVPAP